MTLPKTTTRNIQLSSYGYGMMAMSTTIVILLLNGFFQKMGIDLLATWFVVALAAISGALAVALVRVNLPHLRAPVAITYVTILLIILFASYLTSFIGYSKIYVMYFLNPLQSMRDFSFSKFMGSLTHMWLGVLVMAIACTAAYLIIQYLSPNKKHANLSSDTITETDGLAE